MRVAGFDWDEGNRSKCTKHGVSAAVIESMFRRTMAVFPDPAHSVTEERFIAIGKTVGGRGIFAIFTLRSRGGQQLVRPISARYMHQREMDYYEKEIAAAQKR